MKQLHRNIGFSGISQVLYTFMAFILVPFVARYLKSDGYGIYNLAAIIGFFFNLLSDMGVSTLLTVEVSKAPRSGTRLLASALGLKLLLMPAAFLVILLYLKISALDAVTVAAVLIFIISAFFTAFSSAFCAVFRGRQRMEFETIVTVLDKAISVSLGIFLLVSGFGIKTFLLSFVIAEAVKFFLCIHFLQKHLMRVRISFNLSRLKPLLIKAVPFGLSVFLAVFYNYTAILMLSSMADMRQVGLYSAGFKFLTLATFIPTVLATAFLPQLAENRRRPEELTRLFFNGLQLLLFFSLPMIPFVTFYAEPFIRLVFGSDFNESALFLKILVWGAFAQMSNIYLVSLYSAVGRQKVIVRFQTAALLVNLALNFILIRSLAALGASITTLITEWSILLPACVYAALNLLKGRTAFYEFFGYTAKILAAVAVMTFAALLMRFVHWNQFFSIIVTAGLYIAAAQLFGAVRLRQQAGVFRSSFIRKTTADE